MWHVNDSKYLCWLADWLIALGSHIEFIVGYCNPECGVVFHGSCGCVWNWGIVHEWPTHRESDENPLKFGVLHFQTNQERNLLRLNHLMWLRSKRVQELFCVQIRYRIHPYTILFKSGTSYSSFICSATWSIQLLTCTRKHNQNSSSPFWFLIGLRSNVPQAKGYREKKNHDIYR